MYATDYLPQVAWRFKVEDVIFLTEATTENPATYRTTAIPFDSNDPGAREATKSIGHYVVDNVGHCYKAIAVGTITVDIEDSFNCGVGPQTGKWAYLAESVGEGTAPFISPIYYRHLDKSARDYLRRIELDILWKHRLFTYVAYASDASGTGFSRTDASLPYQATLESPVEIAIPVVNDFIGLWRSGGTAYSGFNETPQTLTGITPTFNPADGINALITVSAATTITFVALIPGQGGVISVTNSGVQNITVAGSYTFGIGRALNFIGDVIETSGSTNLDILTWYYDGVRVVIDGQYDVGL